MTVNFFLRNPHTSRCHPGLLTRDPEDFQTRYPGFPIVRVGNDIGGVGDYFLFSNLLFFVIARSPARRRGDETI